MTDNNEPLGNAPAEDGKPEPVRPESMKPESMKPESMKPESVKPEPVKPESRKTSFLREIRNNFIYGIIVTLPIVAPVWLIIFVVRKTDEVIKPLLPADWNPDSYLPFQIPGLGLVLSIVGLFVLGTLAKNFFGRTLIGIGENILGRVPIVSNLYTAGKQLVSTVAEQNNRESQEVCMLEYPRKGLWAVAFVTSDVAGAPKAYLPKGYVNVFVPTTPNPTSGFLLMVKRADLKILDMTPEEGAKLIISAGMVTDEVSADGAKKITPSL